MSNQLIKETSPYLLQHANNPVLWYPWCEEAFSKAKNDDKPIFLSIGYSTCHWCHVMEQESFEDHEIAEILNRDYICIKVDKEERPDIDSIYMSICQAVTGSGGWPLTMILSPDKKPFYAGTYIPKDRKYNHPGLMDLLPAVAEQWKTDRKNLDDITEAIITAIQTNKPNAKNSDKNQHYLIENGIFQLKNTFDDRNGGFGSAPKFPIPHNLLFLLQYYKITQDSKTLEMSEKTLTQMYRGGIFDHIGYGFSRYSTDEKWLAPHFEKMLYDNALLIIAYTMGHEITNQSLFKEVAKHTIEYVLRELTHQEGGFYCAQDADSEGVEGKYYLFTPEEIIGILGSNDGNEFCSYFDITKNGNFESKNIPNLLSNQHWNNNMTAYLPKIYEYRKNRMNLHKDDKILVSWNGLMIAALSKSAACFGVKSYLDAAKKAVSLIEQNISENSRLYTSFRAGKHSDHGFIDDYEFYIYGLIALYQATLEKSYIDMAVNYMDTAIKEFWDEENGGFFLYGTKSEQFFIRPKETYDGALPSANSVMDYNLYMLWRITRNDYYNEYLVRQNSYLNYECARYPQGHCFYLYSCLLQESPPMEILCVLSSPDQRTMILQHLPKDAVITILENETAEYPLKNNKTTYYICENFLCRPPVNEL